MAPARGAGLGTNQEAVRRHNLGTTLRHVHGAGRISRAELTGLMQLNRSTIAGLVGELETMGLIERAVPRTERVSAGRPSAGVRVSPDGPYVVAVDLGVDRAVVARVGLGGEVLYRVESPVTHHEAWQVGATVAGLIREVVADAPSSARLVGVGISVPGLVRRRDGLVRLAPNLGWRDVSFGSIVLAALGADVPVLVANDADLGALAEHRRGAGVGIDDVIFLSGNCGVGSGVIVDGRRLEGAAGYAGEVGHLTFDPAGMECHCGSRGCWETEVGGYAIARALGVPEEQVPQLHEILDGYRDAPDPLRPIAIALGQGLASIVNVFNPRLVVLGGYFRALYRLCRAEVDRGLAERALPAPFESVRTTLPGLGADSVLLGAAEVAFEPLFADPEAALAAGVLDAHNQLAG